MLEEIKLLLGAAAPNYSDALINLTYQMAVNEIETYCGRDLDDSLTFVAVRITVIKLGRMGTDGLASQSFSGISENFIDGYPDDIKKILNRKRKLKVL